MLAAFKREQSGRLIDGIRRSVVVRPPTEGPVLGQLYDSLNESYFRACILALPMIAIFVGLQWRFADQSGLLLWALTASFVATFHTRLSLVHRRGGDLTTQIRVRCITLAVAGVGWGTLPLFALPKGNQEKSEAIMALLMVTLFTSNTIFSAQLRRAFWSYQIPLGLTATLGFAVQGTGFARLLAVFMLFCAGSTIVLHDQSNKLVVSSVQLGHDNAMLATDLSEERARLAHTNLELTEVNRELEHRSKHDPLTGLVNRAVFTRRLEQALKAEGETHLAVLFVDIDRFKTINDSHGHRVGDELLTRVASDITSCLRPQDLASRFGGDEFTVLLPTCRNIIQAMGIARRIRAAVAKGAAGTDPAIAATVSIGLAYSTGESDSPASLLRSADAALYRAKQNGRNRVEVFEVHASAVTNSGSHDTDEALHEAFECGDIQGWFQPEVDLFTGEITGAEVLARWVHADGVRTAGSFMHSVERNGLLDELTAAVAASMMDATPGFRRFSSNFRTHINVSASVLRNLDRIDGFIEECRLNGLDPNCVALEVTETAVIEDLGAASAWLQRARDAGMTVFLDDFGMGYCSLGVFAQLPVDGLKIDMSFVRQLTTSQTARAIVRATMQLAEELNLQVIAEGVETEEQAEALRSFGVRHAQGYLFSPAVPATTFSEWLACGPPWRELAGATAVQTA